MTDDGPPDPFTAAGQLATSTHEFFSSLVSAGFTDQQALYLTAQFMTASFRPAA